MRLRFQHILPDQAGKPRAADSNGIIFLLDTLPERFTAAEYARATRICGMATYGTLGFLTALGLLCEDGKSGRGKAWCRV